MKTKDVKRSEAEDRQTLHDAMSRMEKVQKAASRPGRSLKELTRLGGSKSVARRLKVQLENN
jgi:hypothetical protein